MAAGRPVSLIDGGPLDFDLVAHAGHPAEWLPFVAPAVLFALIWLVVRVRDPAAADDAGEGDQEYGAEDDSA